MFEIINEFELYLLNELNRSQNTITAYKRDLIQFFEFLEKEKVDAMRLEKINQTNIMSYLLYLEKNNKSTSTIARNLATIKTFYRYLINNGLVKNDPIHKYKANRAMRIPPQTVSVEVIDNILSLPNTKTKRGIRDKAILELLYASGIRTSELIELKLSDVKPELEYIIVNQKRIIPIGRKSVETLNEYILIRPELLSDPEDKILFVNRSGEKFSRQGLWKLVKHYAKKVGLGEDINPNTFRHSFATHLAENGADIVSLKELLGHNMSSSTQVYFQSRKSKLKEVYDNSHPRK